MAEMVNVYNTNNDVIAKVEYNNNLDVWNGSNWQNGGTGLHLGITRLDDGRFVLIHGTDWQGRQDHAEIITDKKAFQYIMKYDEELLNESEFKELTRFKEEMPKEASNMITINNVEEVLTKAVKPQGNGAMVSVPKKYIGYEVKIIITKQD